MKLKKGGQWNSRDIINLFAQDFPIVYGILHNYCTDANLRKYMCSPLPLKLYVAGQGQWREIQRYPLCGPFSVGNDPLPFLTIT